MVFLNKSLPTVQYLCYYAHETLKSLLNWLQMQLAE